MSLGLVLLEKLFIQILQSDVLKSADTTADPKVGNIFEQTPAHPDTMGENNTCAALNAVG